MSLDRDDSCDLLCLDLPHAEAIRAGLPALPALEPAAAAARALGDPTRLGIATALLSGGELCVCDLAWVVGLARSQRQGRLVLYSLTERGTALLVAVLGPEHARTAEPDHV